MMKSKGIIIILCVLVIISVASCTKKKIDYVSVRGSDTTMQTETTEKVSDDPSTGTLPSGSVNLPKVEFN